MNTIFQYLIGIYAGIHIVGILFWAAVIMIISVLVAFIKYEEWREKK